MSTKTTRLILAGAALALLLSASAMTSAAVSNEGPTVSNEGQVVVPLNVPAGVVKPRKVCVKTTTTGINQCVDVPGSPGGDLTLTVRYAVEANVMLPSAQTTECAVKIDSGGGTLSGSATVSAAGGESQTVPINATAPGESVEVTFC